MGFMIRCTECNTEGKVSVKCNIFTKDKSSEWIFTCKECGHEKVMKTPNLQED